MIDDWKEELKIIFKKEKYLKLTYYKRDTDERFNYACDHLITFLLEFGKGGYKRVKVGSFNLAWIPTSSVTKSSTWDFKPLPIEAIEGIEDLEYEVIKNRMLCCEHLMFMTDEIEEDKMKMQELRYIAKFGYVNDLLHRMKKDNILYILNNNQHKPMESFEMLTIIEESRILWNIQFIVSRYPSFCKKLKLGPVPYKVKVALQVANNEI